MAAGAETGEDSKPALDESVTEIVTGSTGGFSSATGGDKEVNTGLTEVSGCDVWTGSTDPLALTPGGEDVDAGLTEDSATDIWFDTWFESSPPSRSWIGAGIGVCCMETDACPDGSRTGAGAMTVIGTGVSRNK